VEQAHHDARQAAAARAAQEAIERAALACINQPVWMSRDSIRWPDAFQGSRQRKVYLLFLSYDSRLNVHQNPR